MNLFVGLSLTAAIPLLAYFSTSLGNPLGTVTSSIVIGLILGNSQKCRPIPAKFDRAFGLVEKKGLYLAIFLMGIKLDLSTLASIGGTALSTVVFAVASGLILALALGWKLLPSQSLTKLVAIGTAICGSSAIAAAAPLIKKEGRDVVLAIALVNLLGFLGMFLVPLLCQVMQVSETASSFLIGSSLQAVGQVVAAGFSMGDGVGDLAVLIKMGRVAMLIPLLLVLSLISRRDCRWQASIPLYLLGFCIMALVRTFGNPPPTIVDALSFTSSLVLAGAMAAMGIRMNLNQILRESRTLISYGILLMGLHIASLLAWIYSLGIQ